MILSFIEGSILSKNPAAVHAVENTLRQPRFSLSSSEKEMTLFSSTMKENTENEKTGKKGSDSENVEISNYVKDGIDRTDTGDTDLNDDNGTGEVSDSVENNTILEFKNTGSELVSEITVNLDAQNTEIERSMTMNSVEMEAFRRKYDELMKQLETERFERELIARSR